MMPASVLMAVRVYDRASDSMCPRFFGIFRSSCFVIVTIRIGADKPIKSTPSSRPRRVAGWSRLHWIIVHFIERGACHVAPLPGTAQQLRLGVFSHQPPANFCPLCRLSDQGGSHDVSEWRRTHDFSSSP